MKLESIYFISSIIMAIFALITMINTICSNKKQKRLLQHQNKIQEKQYLLSKADKLLEFNKIIQSLLDDVGKLNVEDKTIQINFFYNVIVNTENLKLFYNDDEVFDSFIKEIVEYADKVNKGDIT